MPCNLSDDNPTLECASNTYNLECTANTKIAPYSSFTFRHFEYAAREDRESQKRNKVVRDMQV